MVLKEREENIVIERGDNQNLAVNMALLALIFGILLVVGLAALYLNSNNSILIRDDNQTQNPPQLIPIPTPAPQPATTPQPVVIPAPTTPAPHIDVHVQAPPAQKTPESTGSNSSMPSSNNNNSDLPQSSSTPTSP